MSVAGIDLSTRHVDIVAISEDHPNIAQHLRITLKGGWWHAAHTMRSEFFYGHGLYGWLQMRNVHLVGIERPYSTPKQIGTACKLHTILGAVLASLPTTVTPFEVSPNDMRLELGLPGNCPKDVMRADVYSRLRTTAGVGPDWPDDGYDAWAAAHATLRINERASQEVAK